MSQTRYRPGETVLLIAVPEAGPVVGAWRERYDSSAAAGVPPHVTVLYPFLDIADVDTAALTALIAGHRAFDVRFERSARFPGVLYLAPEPDAPFRALTEDIAARWPEAPPYGGQFDDIVPHLTVAHGQPTAVLDEVAADVAEKPIAARVSSVRLMVTDGERWEQRAEFPLAGG